MGNLSGMEALRTYLATLKPKEQAAYAIRAGTTIGYLRKALSRGQQFDGALARRLDIESGGAVPRGDLRSDIWPDEEEVEAAASAEAGPLNTPEAVALALASRGITVPAEGAAPRAPAAPADPDAGRVQPFVENP